ncbi:hypothetical protein [Streptomyces decoyicus]
MGLKSPAGALLDAAYAYASASPTAPPVDEAATGEPAAGAPDGPVPAVIAPEKEDLAGLAVAAGSLTAAVLADTEDPSVDGYAPVLHHLVEAAPAPGPPTSPRVLAALAGPELAAFYPAATPSPRATPTPSRTVRAWPRAALTLRRALSAPVAGQQQPSATVVFVDRAMFDLLSVVWSIGVDLAGDLRVSDQNYQGGMNSSFYKAERMLDGDPYRVLIGD